MHALSLTKLKTSALMYHRGNSVQITKQLFRTLPGLCRDTDTEYIGDQPSLNYLGCRHLTNIHFHNLRA